MSIAHASSSVTFPFPSLPAGRTSLARNPPDEGESYCTSRRMDILLRGAREAPRVKICAHREGIESVGEGDVCVGGSYLHSTTVQTLLLFL
jgi:hypothetical protein